MKKFFITFSMLLAVMGMKASAVTVANDSVVKKVITSEMRVSSLGRYLDLNDFQKDVFGDIQKVFDKEITDAMLIADNDARDRRIKAIVNYMTVNARKYLDDSQYRKYMKALNVTLINRGLYTC